jgi:hypothetical protein
MDANRRIVAVVLFLLFSVLFVSAEDRLDVSSAVNLTASTSTTVVLEPTTTPSHPGVLTGRVVELPASGHGGEMAVGLVLVIMLVLGSVAYWTRD